MKPLYHTMIAVLAAWLIAGAGPVAAGGARPEGRQGPRIIFGAHGDTSFEFDSLKPIRRSAASSRQAYFGSGALYDTTLENLQNNFQEIERRYRFEGLPLSPAQESAKESMSPALMRALALAKKQRADTEAE